MRNKGLFIVFEGVDKSGKTTQAKLLKDYLGRKGENVILTREPGGTDVSEKIREIILDPKNKMSALCELFLYEASRADHVENLIKPYLEKGYIVISDRFALASVVYQGYGRGLGADLVLKLNKIATSSLKVDITFGLDIDEKEYYSRSNNFSKKDRLENEDSFIRGVIRAYKEVFKKDKKIIVVDATKKIDEIHSFIVNKVEEKLCKLK